MGESPIFTCKAHVFHIDPGTKRSWLPASSLAVPVSFFYDSSRGLYRIISVEGTKAVINSTLTPSMTFTKTSQKFGQWSDVRANTVYGLGFPSEGELNKFIEQFATVKEATKGKGGGTTNGGSGGGSASNIPIPPPESGSFGREDVNSNEPNVNTLSKGSSSSGGGHAHARSQSLSAVSPPQHPTANTESPKHVSKGGADLLKGPLKYDTSESGLKYENERLRLALSQSCSNAKQWEIELGTLTTNNNRLTAALTESKSNVDQWQRQLSAYKDENQRLKQRALEAEAASGNTDAAQELRKELGLMRDKVDILQTTLRGKEEELKIIKDKLTTNQEGTRNTTTEVESVRGALASADAQLEAALGAHDSQRRVLEALNSQLADKIQELLAIHREVNVALQT